MGNEESTPIDESTPPQTLSSRTLAGLAEYLTSESARNIVVLSGAGISTSAGIPDFRSPDTGLYANLQRLNLPYAEAVFDISYFRQRPEPFYALARELYPGRFRPTVTHSFIRLLSDKGVLMKHFTQNIDCLDREAGVPGEKIIEAHGSFAEQSCVECGAAFPKDQMLELVDRMEVPRCKKEECGGLVKPQIVFFGESLPAAFFANRLLPAQADLCIILGTSLTVQPFASLPMMASEGTPRVLINLERVGGIGSRPDDVLLLGDCDDGVRKLADACGWRDELERLWAETEKPGQAGMRPSEKKNDLEKPSDQEQSKNKDDAIHEEIEKLTQEIDKTLKVSGEHEKQVLSDPSLVQRIGNHLEGKIGPEQLEKARERVAKIDDGKPTVKAGGIEGDSKTEAAESEVINNTQAPAPAGASELSDKKASL